MRHALIVLSALFVVSSVGLSADEKGKKKKADALSKDRRLWSRTSTSGWQKQKDGSFLRCIVDRRAGVVINVKLDKAVTIIAVDLNLDGMADRRFGVLGELSRDRADDLLSSVLGQLNRGSLRGGRMASLLGGFAGSDMVIDLSLHRHFEWAAGAWGSRFSPVTVDSAPGPDMPRPNFSGMRGGADPRVMDGDGASTVGIWYHESDPSDYSGPQDRPTDYTGVGMDSNGNTYDVSGYRNENGTIDWDLTNQDGSGDDLSITEDPDAPPAADPEDPEDPDDSGDGDDDDGDDDGSDDSGDTGGSDDPQDPPDDPEAPPPPPSGPPPEEGYPNPDDPGCEGDCALLPPLLKAVVDHMFPLPNVQNPIGRYINPGPEGNETRQTQPPPSSVPDRRTPYVNPGPNQEDGHMTGPLPKSVPDRRTPYVNPNPDADSGQLGFPRGTAPDGSRGVEPGRGGEGGGGVERSMRHGSRVSRSALAPRAVTQRIEAPPRGLQRSTRNRGVTPGVPMRSANKR